MPAILLVRVSEVRMFFAAYVFLISALVVLSPSAAGAPPDLSVQPKRSVVITGPIARGNLFPLGDLLLEWSAKDPKTPVDLVINSPGGEIVTGFMFVNQLEAVRARGTKIRCFVPTVAASMAFQILAHCDERYTLDRAFLLWHGVRTFGDGTPITAELAESLAYDLQVANATILSELDATLGLSKDKVRFHFLRETLHIGADLARLAPRFLKSYPAIPGLMEALAESPSSASPGLFGESVFRPGEIVYLAPALVQ